MSKQYQAAPRQSQIKAEEEKAKLDISISQRAAHLQPRSQFSTPSQADRVESDLLYAEAESFGAGILYPRKGFDDPSDWEKIPVHFPTKRIDEHNVNIFSKIYRGFIVRVKECDSYHPYIDGLWYGIVVSASIKGLSSFLRVVPLDPASRYRTVITTEIPGWTNRLKWLNHPDNDDLRIGLRISTDDCVQTISTAWAYLDLLPAQTTSLFD